MNKFILEQLQKCKVAKILGDPNDYTKMIIPKVVVDPNDYIVAPIATFRVGQHYIIEIDDSLITPGEWYNTIHTQWNTNNPPLSKRYQCEVVQFAGKMMKIKGSSLDTKLHWEGWLPKGNVTLLQEL